jgi:uncharacterized membrane protein YdbT with pleckstrin-like domain
MSYVNSTLMKNETVLYQTKPHWIVFGWPLTWLLITVLLFIFGPSIPTMNYVVLQQYPAFPIYAIVAYVTLFLAVITAISSFIIYQTSEYAITNKRVLMKLGFIRRTVLEIFVQKIESVKVSQPVVGRLFGYGSIIISGVGGSKDPFRNIPDPLEFRRRVQDQIDSG